jgi:hypothetical protein
MIQNISFFILNLAMESLDLAEYSIQTESVLNIPCILYTINYGRSSTSYDCSICDLDWMPSSRESDVIGHLNCGSGRVGSTNDSLHRKPI